MGIFFSGIPTGRNVFRGNEKPRRGWKLAGFASRSAFRRRMRIIRKNRKKFVRHSRRWI